MKTITYTTSDKSLTIRLEIKRLNPYMYYKGHGKCWPITTQCLLFINERLVNHGEVIKHSIDIDNPKLGAMLACRKAMDDKLNIKSIRKEIWRLFHEIEY